MHRLAIVSMIVSMVVFVACAQTVADNAVRACNPLCGCVEAPLPSAQQDCVATCTTQFERGPLSEACIECIGDHADRCTTLFDECTPFCIQTVPLAAYAADAPPPELDREGPTP